MERHWPKYQYCDDPFECCSTFGPIRIDCGVCGQEWPCETKRSHVTAAEAARIARWAEGRRGRPAMEAA